MPLAYTAHVARVLKLTGEIQGLNIEAAQGSDEASAIATEQVRFRPWVFIIWR